MTHLNDGETLWISVSLYASALGGVAGRRALSPLLAPVRVGFEPSQLLRPTRQHHALTVRATLVADLELVTALRKDGPLVQPVERTANWYGADVREDFESVAYGRLEAKVEA